MALGKRCLEGKVAMVTGGGTGLGKAIALALASEGADIVAAARRLGPIEQTAKEVIDLGTRGLAIVADVTDSQQVNRLVEQTLSEMGRIDILVNSAGIVRGEQRKPIWDITDGEWHRGIDTNLTGAFFCCRAVGKYLVTQKSGKIINIASGMGLRGGRDNFMYCCAKGGVIQLTRALAVTWAEANIQVNSIAPTGIDVSHLQPDSQRRMALRTKPENVPVGRIGIPQDIASLALFLASDASSYITGALFVADGGGMVGCAPTGYAPIADKEVD